MAYNQSRTRRLAFGSASNLEQTSHINYFRDEKYVRHLNEFYNNSTLSLIAKIFTICILATTIILLLQELFKLPVDITMYEGKKNRINRHI